ncbi:MAG TPA: glycogen debranching protein GlgX [Pirellulaceae bacterium]|nr:glycogen debranching protein GlgX [Pirellulaceae bacterium]HMO91171.1 glycogen debranching protein GlgX [Pirellulaceae bacterium]HMP69059.1 glycogen debranching protein GlgX [Pirellulaceae bacterium]
MPHTHPGFQFTHVLPYGAVVHDGGTQFIVFSRNASEMRLLLYDKLDDLEPNEIIEFNRRSDRWGDIWSIFLPDIGPGKLYHFQASGPYDPSNGHRFDPTARLIDPYAKALAGVFQTGRDNLVRPPKCVVVDDFFDWEGDRHIRRDLSETIIYEMHVKGFTRHPSSKVEHPGTYLGIIEKIPYLKSLGVTAVELMPVHEFPIDGAKGGVGGQENYWGYDPLSFFAPHRGYAASTRPGAQVHEFKQMVKALHAAGIEVILDVVFNHTCEGNHLGPTLSFKGLDNSIYYMLENDRSLYKNFSGCGNTVNGNHPVVRELIFNCLRNWVHNYHVDGFRFDLASILSRDRSGNLIANPPLVELIGEDPLLRDTKIIAEAWDAAGAYQVGSFGDLRWAEWNGRFRDDVRRYWRGDAGMRGALATRLAGSADLYQNGNRAPYCSINFITSHDGFTMNDLVSYREKHNWANGENNGDGENNNHSENYGVEGPTDDIEIDLIRLRQIKNLMSTLLLSQGVPMIVSGDECRRTQMGNNNAYCQDNEISWFDWSLVDSNTELVRFCSALMRFRRQQSTVRQTQFLTGGLQASRNLPDVSWFSPGGGNINWQEASLPMTCLFIAPPSAEKGSEGDDLLLMLNPSTQDVPFAVPSIVKRKKWHLFLDTSAKSPDDIYESRSGPLFSETGQRILQARSMCVYWSRFG